MAKVDKETGEVISSKLDLVIRGVHDSVGLDFSDNHIQNQDFVWDNEARDFKVVDTDIEDRQAYIDSFASETGIYNIMKMYAKTGDISVLNKKQGFYGDISNLPVDELNPGKVAEAAEKAVGSLNKVLGVSLTSEQLASMSAEELSKIITDATVAIQGKVKNDDKKKDGE